MTTSSLPLIQILKDGLAIAESAIVFKASPASFFTPLSSLGEEEQFLSASAALARTPFTPSKTSFSLREREMKPRVVKKQGDVLVVTSVSLDLAVWRIGGAAVPLKLVQLANVCCYCH
jgi:hypothetical protein